MDVCSIAGRRKFSQSIRVKTERSRHVAKSGRITPGMKGLKIGSGHGRPNDPGVCRAPKDATATGRLRARTPHRRAGFTCGADTRGGACTLTVGNPLRLPSFLLFPSSDIIGLARHDRYGRMASPCAGTDRADVSSCLFERMIAACFAEEGRDRRDLDLGGGFGSQEVVFCATGEPRVPVAPPGVVAAGSSIRF